MADAERLPTAEEAVEPTSEPSDPEAGAEEELEWWQDPRMPWKGKPGKQDIACWIMFSLTGVYGLVMMPLRPIIFAASPYVLAGITGSRTAVVTIGALTAVQDTLWPLGLALATIAIMKFDWLYFWAGKLWGRGLIEVVAGRSKRSARQAERGERIARKLGPFAIAATYLIPLPSAVIFAAVAAAGMRWRTFLVVNAVSSFVTRAGFMYLGYRLGEPAVEVVRIIADYSWYLSLAILGGMLLAWIIRKVRRRNDPGSEEIAADGTAVVEQAVEEKTIDGKAIDGKTDSTDRR